MLIPVTHLTAKWRFWHAEIAELYESQSDASFWHAEIAELYESQSDASFWHAEIAELYESQSDASFVARRNRRIMGSAKRRLFCGTQKSQNYMNRKAMPLLWHAEIAELYEAQSDASFVARRMRRIIWIVKRRWICVRQVLRFLRFLREIKNVGLMDICKAIL